MKAANHTMLRSALPYGILLLFALVNYWPVSLHLFSLKNDALIYFLPYRYHVSEAVQNGYFPFWSPYLYTGLPLHADIQSGVWNPVVMLISVFTRYSMTVMQWELLLYIFLGGAGFYRLCRFLRIDGRFALVLAASYMAGGFMIDSASFIPWITSAAWLPFVFLYFLRLLQQPSVRNSLGLGLSLTLLFLSGYVSFFIITAYLLSGTVVVRTVLLLRKKQGRAVRSLWLYAGGAALLALLLCSPALLSYVSFFSYYQRGDGVSLERAETNPFSLVNLCSYVFPPASYRLDGDNDISSRNAFIGLIPLLFFLYGFRFRFSSFQKVLLSLTAFLFLFCLGNATPVRAWCYHLLPLMDSFRHPGTVRLFTNTGILLLAGFGYERYVQNRETLPFRKFLYGIFALVLLTIVLVCILSGAMPAVADGFRRLAPNSEAVKQFLDTAPVQTWLILSGLAQLACLALLLLHQRRTLQAAAFTNLLICTALCMPFTMVSKFTAAQADRFVLSHPAGFPASLAWLPVENNVNHQPSWTLLGYEDFYSKRISIQDQLNNPTITGAYETLIADSAGRAEAARHPFAYLRNNGPVGLRQFGPNAFRFEINSASASELMLTQQYHHFWKAEVNGQAVPVERNGPAFMKIRVLAGQAQVHVYYRPGAIVLTAWLSLILFLGCIGLLVYFRWKQ